MYREKVNKIALSSNDDKRLQTFDRVTTNPHGKNAFKVCKSEMMMVKKNYNKIEFTTAIKVKDYKCKYK